MNKEAYQHHYYLSLIDLPLTTLLKSPTGIWIGKSTMASEIAKRIYHPAKHVTKAEAPAPCM